MKYVLTAICFAVVLPPLTAQTPALDARWADLGSPDDGKALRSALSLSATPKETLAFLKDNLKPVKVDPKRVAELVKGMQSANFVVRTRASAELEYLGKYIKKELESAAKESGDAETKSRIQQLIEKMPPDPNAKKEPAPKLAPNLGGARSISVSNVNGQITIIVDGVPLDFSKMAPPPPPAPPGPPSGWRRAVRAVTLLEHLATPEARDILQTIANGESDALPTIAAKEALGRLAK
ncbi:MAG: hypothetical protein EXS16_07595 [Gemmataceae bacterium]|nr:hypothetical protein [Gemmataceae bacterium]